MPDDLLAKYGTSRAGHAIFAPSASASWLNCSASLLVNARARDSAGIEAAEGTVAHTCAENWNKAGQRPDYMLGQTYTAVAGGNEYSFVVDENMLYHVGRFVQWCNEIPGDHYFEQKVDLSELMPIPDQRGTADHFVCDLANRRLTITDLKYGTGVRVFAEGNTQLLLYAAGAFMAWDWIYGFQEIVLRICQPRLDVFETVTIDRKSLLEFMAYVRKRALDAWVEDAPRTPSPKACQWCAGFERCPARLALLDEIIDNTEGFDEGLDPPEPTTYFEDELRKHTDIVRLAGDAASRMASPQRPLNELSTEALAYAYNYRRSVEEWFKKVGDILLDRAEKGAVVPYFALSDGRANRKFKDQEPAAVKSNVMALVPELREDDVMPRKVASVAQIEKAIKARTGKKPAEVTSILADLVHVVRSKRSLVPVQDERPDEDDLLDDFDIDGDV